MDTEVLQSYNNLQNELEQARNSLKGVDENIKRLIGRDPSEVLLRPGNKRGLAQDGRRNVNARQRNFQENDEPPSKRRNNISVFKRLSDRPSIHDEPNPPGHRHQIISKVIVTPKEVPSRQEALALQSKDEKSKARNRRMFGALLGTLQKFQLEETKLKQREEKRAQLEKKIEEHEIKEKQEIRKERQQLFFNRWKKQAEIKTIELKMLRMKDFALWEEKQNLRSNFIVTKAKPHIHYLPRRMTEQDKALLEASKKDIENMIEDHRKEIVNELAGIEERMKKKIETKSGMKNKTTTTEVKDVVVKAGEDSEEEHDLRLGDEVAKDEEIEEEPEKVEEEPQKLEEEPENQEIVEKNHETTKEPSPVKEPERKEEPEEDKTEVQSPIKVIPKEPVKYYIEPPVVPVDQLMGVNNCEIKIPFLD